MSDMESNIPRHTEDALQERHDTGGLADDVAGNKENSVANETLIPSSENTKVAESSGDGKENSEKLLRKVKSDLDVLVSSTKLYKADNEKNMLSHVESSLKEKDSARRNTERILEKLKVNESAHEREVKRLQKRLEDAKKHLRQELTAAEEVKAQLEEAKTVQKEAKEKFEDLEAKIGQGQLNLHMIKSERDDLLKENRSAESMQVRLNDMKKRNSQLSKDKTRFRESVKELTEKYETTSGKQAGLWQEITELESKREGLIEQCDEAEKRNSALAKTCSEVHDEIQNLKAQIAAERKDLSLLTGLAARRGSNSKPPPGGRTVGFDTVIKNITKSVSKTAKPGKEGTHTTPRGQTKKRTPRGVQG